jgi:hypothetical protein
MGLTEKGALRMPAKGFQLRSMHPHPDRSVAFPPKAEPQATSWWLSLSPAEFYAKAKTEQARMSPTTNYSGPQGKE